MARNVPVVTAIPNPDREESNPKRTPELRAIRGIPAERERPTDSE